MQADWYSNLKDASKEEDDISLVKAIEKTDGEWSEISLTDLLEKPISFLFESHRDVIVKILNKGEQIYTVSNDSLARRVKKKHDYAQVINLFNIIGFFENFISAKGILNIQDFIISFLVIEREAKGAKIKNYEENKNN